MSELVGQVAATGVKLASKGLFSVVLGAVPWLPLALGGAALVATLAGAGTAVWYRMQWKDCQASAAQALIEQRQIDQRDNALAVGQLTGKLHANEANYDKAMAVLATIPRNNACERDTGVRAARELLCAKYPKSEACNRPIPAAKVP